MKKIILTFLLALMLLPYQVKADEGMWFLMFIERLNQRDMEKQGLQLTAEEIYSVNNNSLKDAIVQFGGGCTAEMVSSQGLVMTNHHCGYATIAELSSPEHDYLGKGFWAASKKDELKPKKLSVRFFVRMDDVSKRILSLVNDTMNEGEREKIINQEIAKIEKENNENGKYVVSVRPFFQGNEYYYFVYQDYNDVRLVGTPPSSIGKFGGDTDNWEWPRHTGDFSIFRVYADKDGNPAEYSADNVPLKPKHHLPISIKGYKENDFSMILGYPGRTNRWMPAGGVEQNVNYAYPAWVEGSRLAMDQLKKHMNKNPKVKIDYASKYAGIANYWKNRQGMIDALKLHNTASTKREAEKEFNTWANKRSNTKKYGKVITSLEDYYAKTNEKAKHDNYLMLVLRSSSFVMGPYRIGKSLKYYSEQNEAKRTEIRPAIQEEIDRLFDGINLSLEEDMLAAQLNLYVTKANTAGLAPFVGNLVKENKGNFSMYVKEAFKKSIFTDKKALESYLDKPQENLVDDDPLYLVASDLVARYNRETEEEKQLEEDYTNNFRLLVEGLRASKLNKIQYPDANSTLRLTYGSVISLPEDPRNDASENYYTTLKGVIAKYKPNDDEFDVPAKLIELYNKKDYGRYSDKEGDLVVNFLTNHDITGGNSGSPVLNAKGELLGLAFDGNIEAMASDVIYDAKLQRTINVDIRYVLFIIEKYANAQHIIDELTIVE